MSVIAGLYLMGTLFGTPTHGFPPAMQTYTFGHDGILGTSLDLTFTTTTEAAAARAEAVALAEIDRLRLVLSSYDQRSELSRLMARRFLARPSPDLQSVLQQYHLWHARSGGAYSDHVASLTSLWREAELRGTLPDSASLAVAVARIREPGWQFDTASGSLRLLTDAPIDLSSLGKGYIIDHAVAAVQQSVPEVVGGLINLGGDVKSWGAAPEGANVWLVGVADPRSPADNAPPLTVLNLKDHAVSSSGGYARGFLIGGVHYSHILDPRTGRPSGGVVGTTVIAADNATANALATTLSVLSPVEGLALATATPGVEALIVGSEGTLYRTAGFRTFERPAATGAPKGALKATVTINITPTNPNRHRPYVAVWVTDTSGALIKTLAFWGTKAKYVRELSKWYDLVKPNQTTLAAVTRATRAAGEYTLDWDGLKEDGTPATNSTFLFWFEASFENGPHSLRSAKVTCATPAGTGTFESTSAFAGGSITCTEAR